MALSRKPFGIGHMFISSFLFRMTDTITSQNIDLSSWDTMYKYRYACGRVTACSRWKFFLETRQKFQVSLKARGNCHHILQVKVFQWALGNLLSRSCKGGQLRRLKVTKVNVTLEQATKAERGIRGTDLLFL
jgi:hypothetical protein